MVEDWEKREIGYDGDEKLYNNNNSQPSKTNCVPMESINTDLFYVDEFEQVVKNTKKRRMQKYAIITSVIVVAGILIMFSLWSGIFNINPESGEVIAKYSLRDSGPTINLQSSSTGSLSAIPDENYFATYGYYMNGDKIGQAITSIDGQETYQGVDCYKIKTIGNLEITSSGSTIKSTFESFEYHKVEDDMMIDINIEHQYLEPLDYTQTTEINLNQENGEMTTTISPSNGQATTTTCQFPPEYFQMGSNLKENKYVGFSDEIAYTMDMSYLEPIEVTLTLSIVGQEDITVDNGYYEDCYIVELLQEYEVMGIDQTMLFTIWITSDNITPQMEITTESMSISTTITMKLDDYYTTSPPEGNTVA